MFCAPLWLFGVSLCPAALPGFRQMHPFGAQIVCSLSVCGGARLGLFSPSHHGCGASSLRALPCQIHLKWDGEVQKSDVERWRGYFVLFPWGILLGKKCLEAICKAFYYLAVLWCKSVFSCCVLLHSWLSRLEQQQQIKLIVNTKNLLDIFYYYLFKWGPVKLCPITVGKSPSLISVRKWWWRLAETLAGACWLAWGARQAVGAGGAVHLVSCSSGSWRLCVFAWCCGNTRILPFRHSEVRRMFSKMKLKVRRKEKKKSMALFSCFKGSWCFLFSKFVIKSVYILMHYFSC